MKRPFLALTFLLSALAILAPPAARAASGLPNIQWDLNGWTQEISSSSKDGYLEYAKTAKVLRCNLEGVKSISFKMYAYYSGYRIYAGYADTEVSKTNYQYQYGGGWYTVTYSFGDEGPHYIEFVGYK